MSLRRTSKPRKKAPDGCHVLCRRGNPNRDQQCTCEGCGGKAHGSHKITMGYLIDKVHHKLMDETLPMHEFESWLTVMQSMLDNDPSKRRHLQLVKKKAS